MIQLISCYDLWYYFRTGYISHGYLQEDVLKEDLYIGSYLACQYDPSTMKINVYKLEFPYDNVWSLNSMYSFDRNQDNILPLNVKSMEELFLRNQVNLEEMFDRITSWDNGDLLEAYVGLAGGDDYDGAFTREGSIEFSIMGKLVQSRLKRIGWL